MAESEVGRFSAATRRIADPSTAFERSADHLGPPVATWSRGDDRLDGYGVAARLAFRGADRLRSASSRWRDIAAAAMIDDPVEVPGSGLVAFGTFAFADGSDTDSVLIVPSTIIGRRSGLAFETVIAGPSPQPAGDPVVRSPQPPMPERAYVDAVRRAVDRIRGGELEKVVLARHVDVTTSADADEVVARLRERYAEAWVFDVDGFFGASPETLVTVRRTAVTSRVLAGTAGRGDDDAADDAARQSLLESPKNRFEHALAVDSLLLTLGGLVDDLALGRPFALGLPNVWHLATDAEGRSRAGVGALDLVAALHPTAAVAGAPRDEALELIDELEPFDRGRYAGPVGWIDGNGDGEWAIGLRSAQWESPGRARAFAGAGIVAASEADAELAETALKLRPVLDALQLVGSEPLPRRAS